MLINVSGCEGVGKSSTTSFISEFFTEHNQEFISTREPGGTPIAEKIRNLVKDFNPAETFHSVTELLLFYAARYQLFKNLIVPSLAEGKHVIADRSFACTFAYQLRASNAITETEFWTIHNLIMKGMPEYDLIFYLHTNTVEEGMERARGRGKLDRIESNEIEFFKRAEAGYREFFDGNSNVISINTSENSPEDVKQIVWSELARRT